MTRFGITIAAIAFLLIQLTQQVLFATIAGAKVSCPPIIDPRNKLVFGLM